jgi:hypothetical protein
MPHVYQEEQKVIEARIRMRKEELEKEAERETELAIERERRLKEGPPPEPPRPRIEPPAAASHTGTNDAHCMYPCMYRIAHGLTLTPAISLSVYEIWRAKEETQMHKHLKQTQNIRVAHFPRFSHTRRL